MPSSDFWIRITSLYVSQTWPVILCMYKNVLSIRMTSLYGSQPSSVVLRIQNSDLKTKIACVYGSQTYWILGPWDSTIEHRCLLCAPSSCVATPPASGSKSGGRKDHLVIDGGVCLCVCVCTLAVWSSEHEASRVLDGSHFTAFTPFYNWTTTMKATTSLPALNKAWVRALLALPSPYWAK